jgi:UDP-GlcNAc:undecaprenyl-phosphate GlcNAc-1-phosphate transferase
VRELRIYLLGFAIALAGSYIITFLIEKFAVKVGAVDIPNARKIHVDPVPRLGGLAIYISFALSLLVLLLIDHVDLSRLGLQLWGILIGGTFIVIVGAMDDIAELSVRSKLLGQTIAAIILFLFGSRIEFIGNPLGGLIYLGGLSVFLTLFWMIGLTNTVNLIDGLDGLAAGVSSIALVILTVIAFETGRQEVAFVCLVLLGSVLGFLKHNFNPASIFMGDSGSMFLGFMLAAVTVQGVMKSAIAIALLVPIVIMGVPILDTAFAIFRRFREKQPLTQADNDHIHHRLLHKGFSQVQTVVIIYVWTAVLGAAALTLRFASNKIKLLVFLGLALVSLFFDRFVGLFESPKRDVAKRNLGDGNG